jgi:hypothetical protein
MMSLRLRFPACFDAIADGEQPRPVIEGRKVLQRHPQMIQIDTGSDGAAPRRLPFHEFFDRLGVGPIGGSDVEQFSMFSRKKK